MYQRTVLFILSLPVVVVVALLIGLGETAVAAPPETAANLPTWGPSIPITTQAVSAPFGASQPAIASSANGPTVTIVFNRQMVANGTNNDPWVSRSFNNGTTWTAPVPIYSSSDDSAQTAVVIDDQEGNHAVWREGNRLAYAAEAAWGTGSVQFLSSPAANQVGVATPAIAAGPDGMLAVVWSEVGNGNPNIHFTSSANSGLVWRGAMAVRDTFSSSLFPDVAIDLAGTIHIVWQEHDQAGPPGLPVPGTIYYAHSTLAGWSNPVNLTQVAGVGDGRRPQILLTRRGVQVAFAGQLASDIVHSTLQHVSCLAQCDVALSWTASPPISAGFLFQSERPIQPTLGQYQGCPLVYFHGIRQDLDQQPATVWGGSSCDEGTLLVQATLPPVESFVPQMANQGAYWSYITYETGGTTSQIAFIRNTFKMFLPVVARS